MTNYFEATNELVTVRDFWRFAITQFEAAELSYGHGTDNAADEAAFLLLESLRLPIDRLEPFLEARLLASERQMVVALLEARARRRIPAAYLVRKSYIAGHPFYVDERVIVPRSYIGELLAGDGLATVVADPTAVRRVLDLCTGSGCLAILAAQAFPLATIDAVDLSAEALAVAERNVRDYGLGARIALYRGDLFAPLGDNRYDLILANPPYVSDAAIARFPAEHRAEPPLAHAGGADGLDLVRRILVRAERHLAPGGNLVMEVGTGRPRLEADLPTAPFLWLDTAESSGEVLALAAPPAPAAPPARAAAKASAAGKEPKPGDELKTGDEPKPVTRRKRTAKA
jgi:ribosomal protein L3 glutamine methyltransferase